MRPFRNVPAVTITVLALISNPKTVFTPDIFEPSKRRPLTENLDFYQDSVNGLLFDGSKIRPLTES